MVNNVSYLKLFNNERCMRKQWFLDRIGERVFRNNNECHCEHCQKVYADGLTIIDEEHAYYLYDCECEYAIENKPLRYFDTKEEVKEFEK